MEKKKINQFSDSKLKIYNICKNNFGLEKYLTIVNDFELRRSLQNCVYPHIDYR